MAQALLIACLAGLASALLSGILTPGNAPLLLLILLAPLPLFIAGLGWHRLIAALGGILAALIINLVISERAAIGFAGSIAMPVFGLVVLAERFFLREARGRASDGLDLGRLALITLFYAALLVIASSIYVEPDHAAFMARVRDIVGEVITQTVSGPDIQQGGSRDALTDAMTAMMVPLSGVIILMTLIISGTLGLLVTARAERLPYGKPDFRFFRLPGGALILLGLALLMTLREGYGGAFASIMATGLCFLLMLQGLGVVHARLAQNPARGFLLSLVWGSLIIFGLPALLLIGLGFADHLFNFRRHVA